MAKSITARQQEYREKRLADSVRISVWISKRADARLSALATINGTSREKTLSALLEQVSHPQ